MKNKNEAYIDVAALSNNYKEIKKICRGGNVICVVKADAYGHGAAEVSRLLGEAGCGFFAVSSEAEAAGIRKCEEKHGRYPEILILGHIMPENVPEMIKLGVTCAAVSAENAAALSEAASTCGGRLKVHVKIDTGMNRLGFSAGDERYAETVGQIEKISRDRNLDMCGIFTHFACADGDLSHGAANGNARGMTAVQLSRFERILSRLAEIGVDPGLRHAANSAASLWLPEACFDAVRAGIILYGYMPDGSIDSRFKPVMKFYSTIAHMHTVKKGESVGYGSAFAAKRDSVIATAAAGYADGVRRDLSSAGCAVETGGMRFPVVGNVCMDQLMFDVTDAEQLPAIGDRVTFFGGDDGSLMLDTASRLSTIPYELLCSVSKRVPRIYVTEDGGDGGCGSFLKERTKELSD